MQNIYLVDCKKTIIIQSRINHSELIFSNYNNCALCEESTTHLSILIHGISFNSRCGGKLDLTSESGHLGFFKMATLNIFFSIFCFNFCVKDYIYRGKESIGIKLLDLDLTAMLLSFYLEFHWLPDWESLHRGLSWTINISIKPKTKYHDKH